MPDRRISSSRRLVALAAIVAPVVLSSVVGLATPAAAAGTYLLSILSGTGAAAAPVSGPVSAGPTGRPDAMATDGSGTVWVYLRSACRVVKISPAGNLSPAAGNGTCGTGVAGDALSPPLSAGVTSLAGSPAWPTARPVRVVRGLVNGDTYTVRVRARNGVGAGPAGAAETGTPARVPGAPGGLTATAGDASPGSAC